MGHLLFVVTQGVLDQFIWSLHTSVGRTKCKHPWIQWTIEAWPHSEGQLGEARRWLGKNCSAPDSHCPVEMSSNPGTEDPSYTLSVKRLSVRILFPRFPPSKSGQSADIFPLYIFVFSPLNFCL